MMGSVPYNVRVALQDTTLPRGGGPDGTEPVAVAKGMFREARDLYERCGLYADWLGGRHAHWVFDFHIAAERRLVPTCL